MRLAVLALLALASACAAQSSEGAAVTQSDAPQQLADELMTADRAFAATAASTGGVAALAPMLRDDVVVFAIPVPGFANGRAAAIERIGAALGSQQARFEWTPIRVGVSADGRHGFSFGYVITRAPGEAERPGKYLAYWIRGDEGWQIALYKLVPRPEGEVSLATVTPYLPTRLAAPTDNTVVIARRRAGLAAREQAFSDASQEIGLGAAFVRFGRADAANVGNGAGFTFGNDAIGAGQPGPPGSPLYWSADQGVIVASSGDLGATWGYLHRNGPTPPGRLDVIPFFTVWARTSESEPWLYIAE